MALKSCWLACLFVLSTAAIAPAQAVTYNETFNVENNTLAGAEGILAQDNLIIGRRGGSLFDDESIDFYRFDFIAEGLVLLLDLEISPDDIELSRTPPRMDLYLDDGFGGFNLLASPNLVSTGSFISFLVDLTGPFFLGVSGSPYDPELHLEPPHDTNLTYTVGIQVVPVPAAVWMLGSALAATGLFGRRRG